ncbi:MAG: DAK2 domain-containing protein [Ilumatobacteraceae bacterium]
MTTLERLDVHALRNVITTFRDAVRDHAGGLNRLNVYPVPDGDTGTNMARTLEAVVAEMETADADSLDATCDAISHGSLMGARGNSGVILSQILRGLATTLKDKTEGTGERVADALSAASAGAYQAVLKPIEGTILTVVRIGRGGQGGVGRRRIARRGVACRTRGRALRSRRPSTCCRSSRMPVWSTPAVPAICSCSIRRCMSSTASRCRSRGRPRRPDRRAARQGRPPDVGARR